MKNITSAALILFALAASPAFAGNPDEAACCVQSTSLLDAYINPVRGGDEQFFTISGTIPNIVFAIDTSGSMDWWPSGHGAYGTCTSGGCDECPSTGCDCFGNTGYNPGTTYPPEISSYNTALGHPRLDGSGGRTAWFKNDTVYEFKQGEGYGNSTSANPVSTTWTGVSRTAAIASACAAVDTTYVPYSPAKTCGDCSMLANLSYTNTSCAGTSGAETCRGFKYLGTTNNCKPGGVSCSSGSECTSMTSKCDGKWDNSKCYNLGKGIGCYMPNAEARDTDNNKIWCSPTATSPTNGCASASDQCSQSPSSTADYQKVCKYASLASGATVCKQCLADKGYYTNSANDPITGLNYSRMLGNFLNTYAPKLQMARRTLKEVLASSQPIRIGGVHFNASGNAQPERFYTFSPSCASLPTLNTPTNWDSARNSFITSLNANMNVGGGTPLLRTLLTSGYMFTDADSIYTGLFSSTWASSSVMNISPSPVSTYFKETEPVCASCSGGFNAIVLMTDGVGNNSETGLSSNSKLPANLLGTGKTKYTAAECVGCQDSDLDEVAYTLHSRNLKTTSSNPTYVSTYTVGFGLGTSSSEVAAQKLMAHAAQVGGGLALTASNGTQLASAFETIFNDISKRSTSFSTTSISSMQTGTEKLTAIMPRMSPESGGVWSGQVYRFGLYNEFVEGGTTDSTKLHPERLSSDPVPSIFVVDSDNHIAVEDPVAHVFKRRVDGTKATPYWEAADRLSKQPSADNRDIFTVIDCEGTPPSSCVKDGLFTEKDAVVEFADDNWAMLIDYLGIRGSSAAGDYCPTLVGTGKLLQFLNFTTIAAAAASIGWTVPATPTQDKYDELCARLLINFIRGQDLQGNADPTRKKIRPNALADIFHSSPIVLSPPSETWICDLGLNNQCLRTLYAQDLPAKATPFGDLTDGTACGAAVKRDAYSQYAWVNGMRKKLVLVSGNDGMLHAFDNGTASETSCAAGLRTVDYSTGTGDEVWAFVPPDILPRLKDIVNGHQYLVDGDIMVRDIWSDDNLDGKKQPTEFHTVAIAALGRGGNSYFALDVTKADATPTTGFFRWMYPQPCSSEAAMFGKTLLPITPRPPPIGPVLLKTTGANKVARYGADTEERWIAMLSGGWSPNGDKGRGMYMVDAWRGTVPGRKDNLIWKFDQPSNAPSLDAQQSPRNAITQSIVAPIALVDYGANDSVGLDGFFDTAVVGDLQGQIWVARFYTPGDVLTSPFLATNWAAARAFEQDRDNTSSVSSSLSGESGSVTGKGIANRGPFYAMASTALQFDNNALRVLLGTGDRMHMLAPKAGDCSFDQPLACAKYGCETRSIYQSNRWDTSVTAAETHWKGKTFMHSPRTSTTVASPNGCNTVTASMATNDLVCTPISGSGSLTINDMPRTSVTCQLGGGVNKYYTCASTDPVPPFFGSEASTIQTSTTGLGNNRFYGIWAYGTDPNRMFDETRTATGAGYRTAAQFDGSRLTDRATAAELVDVTCAAATNRPSDCTSVTSAASSTDKGWYLDYRNNLDEKTAGSATVLASCGLWNSSSPTTTSSSTSSCSTVAATAYLYQADYITGAANCAEGFAQTDGGYARQIQRSIVAPPPEPATVIAISKTTRAVRLSSVAIEPQNNVGETVSATTNDSAQSVYELPVPRSLHFCRHGSADKCVPTPP